jgi:hypothetical protein
VRKAATRAISEYKAATTIERLFVSLSEGGGLYKTVVILTTTYDRLEAANRAGRHIRLAPDRDCGGLAPDRDCGDLATRTFEAGIMADLVVERLSSGRD